MRRTSSVLSDVTLEVEDLAQQARVRLGEVIPRRPMVLLDRLPTQSVITNSAACVRQE